MFRDSDAIVELRMRLTRVCVTIIVSSAYFRDEPSFQCAVRFTTIFEEPR